MTAASKKLEGDKDGKKKLMEEARARCSYSSKDKATAAKGSTSAAKLAVPKVPTSLKGRRCAVSNIVDANIRVKSKVSSEGSCYSSILVVTSSVLAQTCTCSTNVHSSSYITSLTHNLLVTIRI